MEGFKTIKVKLENYEILGILGAGSYGKVKLARNKKNNEYYALKILQKSEIIRTKQTDHIISENSILSRINHPFMIRMHGFTQDSKYLYFILEYVQGGELFTLLRKSGKFTLEDTMFNEIKKKIIFLFLKSFYSSQIILMMEYLHSKNIIYRDLKPENILISLDGYLKLCDFGFAKFVDTRTYTLCGTPEYISPEVLLNKGHGKAVDWWALGVFIYEMITGFDPFNADDPMTIYQNIIACKIHYPSMIDKNIKDLISNLLVVDLTKRYGNLKDGINDIKNHACYKDLNWDDLLDKKIKPFYIPTIKAPNDTSNFLKYREEEDNAKPLNAKEDPFINW